MQAPPGSLTEVRKVTPIFGKDTENVDTDLMTERESNLNTVLCALMNPLSDLQNC
jgi:hypothetical protein